MPHLGVGVLVAQLISLLVFYRGEILPRTTWSFNQSEYDFCYLLGSVVADKPIIT